MNRILDIIRRYPVISSEAQRNEAVRDAMNAANTEAAVGTALTPYISDVPTREACAREVVAERRRQAEAPTPSQPPKKGDTNWPAIGGWGATALLLGFLGFHFMKVSWDHNSPASPTVVTTTPAPAPVITCNVCLADGLDHMDPAAKQNLNSGLADMAQVEAEIRSGCQQLHCK